MAIKFFFGGGVLTTDSHGWAMARETGFILLMS